MQISETSRVWIYQSNREFTPQEQAEIQDILNRFTEQWVAHGASLAAKGEVRYGRFVILMVDEAQAGATGCSIDKSVRLMKDLENRFNVDLFDRFNIAYRENGAIKVANRETFESLLASGSVTEETIVFNNLVGTLQELETKWEVPMKESWHMQVFS